MYYPKGAVNSVIPAAEGWAVASLDRGIDGLFLTPVIAWFLVTHVGEYLPGVKPEHSPEKSVGFDIYPITVHGIEEEITALKEPGGAFSIPNIRGGMSEADCLAELKSKPG